jgi:hypothetical protein
MHGTEHMGEMWLLLAFLLMGALLMAARASSGSKSVKLQIQSDHPAIFRIDDGQGGLNGQRSTRDPSKEANP